MKTLIIKPIFLVLLFITVSCNKEYLDPNSLLEPQVVESTENLTRLINGVQKRYSTDRSGIIYNMVHISGLNTGELRLLNPGNLEENEMLLGYDNISNSNGILESIWANAMLIRKECQTVYTSAADLGASAETNTLQAYSLLYTAIANLTLIQYFESIPLEIIENAPFKSRTEVLDKIIVDLVEARGIVDGGLSSTITGNINGSIDIKNTVLAMLARAYAMKGDWTQVLAHAELVDRAAKSTWDFDASVPNPLSFWFSSQNVTQARNGNFSLPSSLAPESGDKRVDFYIELVDPDAEIPDFQIRGFWQDNLDKIPVYLPGEMDLLEAEAYARSGDISKAVERINAVRTKAASNDAFGVGAGLGNYSGQMNNDAVLEEIYRNRRIELYLSGLGLEDSRRFGRPGPNDASPERNRNFYPYPMSEAFTNSNTPANPTN